MKEAIFAALRALLVGDATFLAFFSGDPPRVWCDEAPPEPAFPYVVGAVRMRAGGESCLATGSVILDVYTTGTRCVLEGARISERIQNLLHERFLVTDKTKAWGVTLHWVGEDPIPTGTELVARQQVVFEWQGYRAGTARAILER